MSMRLLARSGRAAPERRLLLTVAMSVVNPRGVRTPIATLSY
jgi:hypothetical protein